MEHVRRFQVDFRLLGTKAFVRIGISFCCLVRSALSVFRSEGLLSSSRGPQEPPFPNCDHFIERSGFLPLKGTAFPREGAWLEIRPLTTFDALALSFGLRCVFVSDRT